MKITGVVLRFITTNHHIDLYVSHDAKPYDFRSAIIENAQNYALHISSLCIIVPLTRLLRLSHIIRHHNRRRRNLNRP